MGLLAAGANIINTLIQGKQSKRNVERTILANKEMAKYAYSKDLEMWQRQNKYNTPEAQMQRLQNAKLNPNLVYGTGTVAGNTSGQIPKYQAPRIDYTSQKPAVDIGGVIGAYQDVKMKNAQIDNIKASTDATRQNTAIGVLREQILDYNLKWERPQKVGTEHLRQEMLKEQTIAQESKTAYAQFVATLAKQGFTVKDSKYMRVMFNMMEQKGIDIGEIGADKIIQLLKLFSN